MLMGEMVCLPQCNGHVIFDHDAQFNIKKPIICLFIFYCLHTHTHARTHTKNYYWLDCFIGNKVHCNTKY